MLAKPSEDSLSGDRHARHLFTVLVVPELAGMSRWEFVDALKAANIGTGIHFLALHLHSYYRDRFGHQPGDFPNAEYTAGRAVSLRPSGCMNDGDVQDVISGGKRAVRRKASPAKAQPCP